MAAALLRAPIPVLLAGFLQSAYLLRKKPWSKDVRGAWAVRGIDVTRPTTGSTLLLFAYRATAALFILVVGVSELQDRGMDAFKYYTVWNWWLLGAYFTLAAAASFSALQRERPNPERRVSRLEHAVVVLFHVNLTTVVVVDVLTWTVLWPIMRSHPDPTLVAAFRDIMFSFTSCSQHGINGLLMLAELLLNNITFMPYMMGYVSLWSSAYSVWTMYYYLTTSHWLYPFLDAMQSWSPAAYLGMFILHWAFFGSKAEVAGRLVIQLSTKQDPGSGT
ncbi:hypothetical protein WJX72_008099 [[Myrmecia] bisecta]|uniref:Uncharacterized protein n=1 Tax=[Myrmecia] bisecta TaxID=41462 RepID=A0AAW1QRN4_9CHLO